MFSIVVRPLICRRVAGRRCRGGFTWWHVKFNLATDAGRQPKVGIWECQAHTESATCGVEHLVDYGCGCDIPSANGLLRPDKGLAAFRVMWRARVRPFFRGRSLHHGKHVKGPVIYPGCGSITRNSSPGRLTEQVE